MNASIEFQFVLKVRTFVGQDIDFFIARLDLAVEAHHRAWAAEERHIAEKLGQEAAGIAPPRDIISYLLDHVIPASLKRSFHGKTHNSSNHIKEIRVLAGELTVGQFLNLLVIYAARKGDDQAFKRALDCATNDLHPCRFIIADFQSSQAGGAEKAKLSVETTQKITTHARVLLTSGKPKRSWAKIISEKLGLTPRHVRRVLKKADLPEQKSV